MFFTYILHNSVIDKYYVGYTSDLESRVWEHNKGSHKSKFTRKQESRWELVYYEEFRSKTEAIKREKEIKRWKSRIRIKKLVEQSR